MGPPHLLGRPCGGGRTPAGRRGLCHAVICYTCICVYTYVCICIYIYIYTHMYTCVCIYTYIYIYIHTYIHIHLSLSIYICVCMGGIEARSRSEVDAHPKDQVRLTIGELT